MRTKTFFRLVIAIILLSTFQVSFAQTTSKLSRKVLFTLGSNENVWYSEYFAQTTSDGNKFTLVLNDKYTKEFTFVFNGKRIVTTNIGGYAGYDNPPFEFQYLNPKEDNGYSFLYHKREGKDTSVYINIKGLTHGSFESAYLVSDKEYWYSVAGQWYYKTENKVYGPFDNSGTIITKNDKYALIGKDNSANNQFINVGGKNIGYFARVEDFSFIKDGEYAFSYCKAWDNECKQSFVNINGQIFGPYQQSAYEAKVKFTEGGKYAFRYKENDKWYVNINGKIFGPYQYTGNLALLESGKYAFTYSDYQDYKNRKQYINIDGKISEVPYEYVIYDLYISENNEFAYYYSEKSYLDDNKININGKIIGTFKNIYNRNLTFTENGKYIFYGCKENDGCYVINNNQTWGPYKYVPSATIDNNGNFSFDYIDDTGFEFNNTNGEITMLSYPSFAYFQDGGNDVFLSWKVFSPDQQHSFYSTYEYEYVVIDGQKVGKSPALRVWYDKQKNAFIWNSIEGKELVIYEYKL